MTATDEGTGTMLLCDNCEGLALSPSTHNPMFPEAECEDNCNLDLDHDGLCGPTPRKRASQRETCTNCGDTDRLHEIDQADVDAEGREALAKARRIAELEEQRDHGNDYGDDEAEELAELTGKPVRYPGHGDGDWLH